MILKKRKYNFFLIKIFFLFFQIFVVTKTLFPEKPEKVEFFNPNNRDKFVSFIDGIISAKLKEESKEQVVKLYEAAIFEGDALSVPNGLQDIFVSGVFTNWQPWSESNVNKYLVKENFSYNDSYFNAVGEFVNTDSVKDLYAAKKYRLFLLLSEFDKERFFGNGIVTGRDFETVKSNLDKIMRSFFKTSGQNSLGIGPIIKQDIKGELFKYLNEINDIVEIKYLFIRDSGKNFKKIPETIVNLKSLKKVDFLGSEIEKISNDILSFFKGIELNNGKVFAMTKEEEIQSLDKVTKNCKEIINKIKDENNIFLNAVKLFFEKSFPFAEIEPYQRRHILIVLIRDILKVFLPKISDVINKYKDNAQENLLDIDDSVFKKNVNDYISLVKKQYKKSIYRNSITIDNIYSAIVKNYIFESFEKVSSISSDVVNLLETFEIYLSAVDFEMIKKTIDDTKNFDEEYFYNFLSPDKEFNYEKCEETKKNCSHNLELFNKMQIKYLKNFVTRSFLYAEKIKEYLENLKISDTKIIANVPDFIENKEKNILNYMSTFLDSYSEHKKAILNTKGIKTFVEKLKRLYVLVKSVYESLDKKATDVNSVIAELKAEPYTNSKLYSVKEKVEGILKSVAGLFVNNEYEKYFNIDGINKFFSNEKEIASYQDKLSAESKKAEEEKKQIEEERKKAEEERKQIEEESKKAEEEKKQIEEERKKAEEERKQIEEEKKQIEEERKKAEEERKKAEEERKKAEEERKKAEELKKKQKSLSLNRSRGMEKKRIKRGSEEEKKLERAKKLLNEKFNRLKGEKNLGFATLDKMLKEEKQKELKEVINKEIQSLELKQIRKIEYEESVDYFKKFLQFVNVIDRINKIKATHEKTIKLGDFLLKNPVPEKLVDNEEWDNIKGVIIIENFGDRIKKVNDNIKKEGAALLINAIKKFNLNNDEIKNNISYLISQRGRG